MTDMGRCEYCGFMLVVEGPRECCRAGRDVDALRAEQTTARFSGVRDGEARSGQCVPNIVANDNTSQPAGWTCIPGRICGGAKIVSDLQAEIASLRAEKRLDVRREWDTDHEAFIQWKGTDVCMDLHCPKCKTHNHYDGFFAYVVECSGCQTQYLMRPHAEFAELTEPKDDHERHFSERPLCDADPDEPEGSDANSEADG